MEEAGTTGPGEQKLERAPTFTVSSSSHELYALHDQTYRQIFHPSTPISVIQSTDPPGKSNSQQPPRSASTAHRTHAQYSCSKSKTQHHLRAKTAQYDEMKCSLLLALAVRAQFGHGFTGPAGGLVLSHCVSAAARCNSGMTNIVARRGVASTAMKAAASAGDDNVSGFS